MKGVNLTNISCAALVDFSCFYCKLMCWPYDFKCNVTTDVCRTDLGNHWRRSSLMLKRWSFIIIL